MGIIEEDEPVLQRASLEAEGEVQVVPFEPSECPTL